MPCRIPSTDSLDDTFVSRDSVHRASRPKHDDAARAESASKDAVLFCAPDSREVKDVPAAGIQWVPRVVGVRDGKPLLADGHKLDVGNVIWCTGFHPGFSWIHLPIFGERWYPCKLGHRNAASRLVLRRVALPLRKDLAIGVPESFNGKFQPSKPIEFTHEFLSGKRYETAFKPGTYLGRGTPAKAVAEFPRFGKLRALFE